MKAQQKAFDNVPANQLCVVEVSQYFFRFYALRWLYYSTLKSEIIVQVSQLRLAEGLHFYADFLRGAGPLNLTHIFRPIIEARGRCCRVISPSENVARGMKKQHEQMMAITGGTFEVNTQVSRLFLPLLV